MNRIIKFRAWDTKQKKFLEVIPPEEYMLDCDDWNYPDEDSTLTYPDEPFNTFDGRIVLQQFIGLKDKNGKEIYEGDIINTKVNRYVIEYSAPKVGFTARGLFYSKAIINPNDLESGFILGNLFENPELLK